MSARRVNSGDVDAQIDAWWKAVLGGDADLPHPIHGDQLRVRLSRGSLILAGEVDRRRDRDEVVREARARLGSGVQSIDASALRVRASHERSGILDQTLLAAFDNHQTAELARDYVLQHSPVKPKQVEIVDPTSPSPDTLLPPEVVADAEKVLNRGQSLLLIRVDETDAFKMRSLLEEDTRSTWTVAAPPQLAGPRAT